MTIVFEIFLKSLYYGKLWESMELLFHSCVQYLVKVDTKLWVLKFMNVLMHCFGGIKL